MHMKILNKRRKNSKDKANHVEKKMLLFCTHCHKKFHLVDKFWTLYPKSHPQHLKKVEKEKGKNGKEDSIVDVGQDDSHDDAGERSAIEMVW